MGSSRSNARLFWLAIAVVVSLDVVTKLIAVSELPLRVPRPVLGMEWFRLTLVYNQGAAFGLYIGDGHTSRFVFAAMSVIAIAVLWHLFLRTRPGDWMRTLAVALVSGGAIGNLIDRLRSPLGVVDFLDLGVGNARWPTFNLADMAVSTGAILLAVVLWREEKHPAPADEHSVSISSPVPQGGERSL